MAAGNKGGRPKIEPSGPQPVALPQAQVVLPPQPQAATLQPGQVMQQIKFEQSPIPNAEMLDGLSRHIDRVGERWFGLFENQVAHEQFIAKESLRVNEELNHKQLDLQKTVVEGDNRKTLFAQGIAGALLFMGLLFLATTIGFALWFFYRGMNLPGGIATLIATTIGYFFKSVVQTYFPGKEPVPKK